MRTWIVTEPSHTNMALPVYILFEEDTLRELYHSKPHSITFEVWLDDWIVTNWATRAPDNIVPEIFNRRQTFIISDSN